MLLYRVKRKVQERFCQSIFHKTATIMNLTTYSYSDLYMQCSTRYCDHTCALNLFLQKPTTLRKLRRISYNFKGRPEETSYEMLLYLVKRKVEERFLFVSIFHKTASTMNLTRYSILNLINAMRFKLVTIETNYLKKIQEHIFFSSNL